MLPQERATLEDANIAWVGHRGPSSLAPDHPGQSRTNLGHSTVVVNCMRSF